MSDRPSTLYGWGDETMAYRSQTSWVVPGKTPTQKRDMQRPSDLDRLIAQLSAIANLSSESKRALRNLPIQVWSVDAGCHVRRAGTEITDCCLVLHGMLARRIGSHAGGANVSFHFAGDLPDLGAMLNPKAKLDHDLVALSPARVAYVSQDALKALSVSSPQIGEALARHVYVDASIAHMWIANLCKPVVHRVAHLFCETYVRLLSRGLATEHEFWPAMTQPELADAIGVSTVHLGRSLQTLRAERCLKSGGQTKIQIEDWGRLQQFAEFDPAYLHLRLPIEKLRAGA